MAPIEISDLDDPRLDPYRDLKHARRSRQFVVEGPRLVERLLASAIVVDSILIGAAHRERFADLEAAAAEVFIADPAKLVELVGYPFHRGVLACAQRPDPVSVTTLAAQAPPQALYVVCPEINEPDNLGAILRNAGSFGADAVLLGERCTDPFSRRAIRASMGGVFTLPILETKDLRADLEQLRTQTQCEIVGAVAEADAQPIQEFRRAARTAVLLGAENQGLHPRFAKLCDHSVTIPLPGPLESLNVAAASAITLYALTGPRG